MVEEGKAWKLRSGGGNAHCTMATETVPLDPENGIANQRANIKIINTLMVIYVY